MYQIQTSTTAGTDLAAEFTKFPKAENCSSCDNSLSGTFSAGISHRGKIVVDDTATAVIVRRASRSNPKLARTIATYCPGCARERGFVCRVVVA